jgi:hypothetical protein
VPFAHSPASLVARCLSGAAPALVARRYAGPALACLVCFLGLAACGGALSEGRSDYDKGLYPQAKQTFLSIEAESRGWSDAQRAEYALYRGLTHASLGDRAQAAVWLREAKAIVEVRPGSLSREDAQRLRLGLEATEAP